MYTTRNYKTKKELKEAVARYLQVAAENARRRKFYQDGPDFYDEETNKIIASYPTLVQGDYDLDGAKDALHMFLHQFPSYRTVLFTENNAEPVTLFAPGLGTPNKNGSETVEGPHFPEPHRWYASVQVKDGIVVSVK
jgi:hypothetical protein